MSFCQAEVRYLGHTITPAGLKPNDDQLKVVKEYPSPKNVKELRQFLGLASYYRRFIKEFAKIAHPLHALTCKGKVFVWTEECQSAFQDLKRKLVTAPVLAIPNFDKGFLLETDASIKGLGAVLSQQQKDDHMHPVAFASRALSTPEKNYSVTDLETLAVVWAVSHFHAYLYGHDVEVRTDHSAVKAVLSTPSPNGKHARWWTKVYSSHASGVGTVTITHRVGKENVNADALSRSPCSSSDANRIGEGEVQVAAVTNNQTTLAPAPDSDMNITDMLNLDPSDSDEVHHDDDFAEEQQKDQGVLEIANFLTDGKLPSDQQRAKKVALQGNSFTIIDNILYYM